MKSIYRWFRSRVAICMLGISGVAMAAILSAVVAVGGVALVAALAAVVLGLGSGLSIAFLVVPRYAVVEWGRQTRDALVRKYGEILRNKE